MTQTRTLAVYPDQPSATRAEEAVTAIAGPDAVHVEEAADIAASKVAEEQAESRHAGPMPATPPMTGQAAKSSTFFALVGGAIGAVLLLPVAFFGWGDADLGTRIFFALFIGAAAGSTFGWLAGGYLGATVSTKPLAVERGWILRVDSTDQEIIQALRSEGPLRIDLTDDVGNLYETDMAEEYDAEGMINRLGRAYAGHDHPDELTDQRRVRGPAVDGPAVDK